LNNYVYLVPLSNGTYVPYVEETAPCEKAVLLTQEGDYPASILSAPFDACDFDDAYEDTVQNRSELLQALLLNGQMGNVIVKLWDHSVHHICSIDICNLFDDVYHTRMDAICEMEM